MTMWIVGLIIWMRPLRPLRPLRPVWRLPAPPIGLSVPSALPLSDGGFFLTPTPPPPWFPVGVGSRRSFGCAAPLGLPVWAGVVAVFGGSLGGVLGGYCVLCWLCCSSSSGRGWSLSCSGSLLSLLRRLCAACVLMCRRCPLGMVAAFLCWVGGAGGRGCGGWGHESAETGCVTSGLGVRVRFGTFGQIGFCLCRSILEVITALSFGGVGWGLVARVPKNFVPPLRAGIDFARHLRTNWIFEMNLSD